MQTRRQSGIAVYGQAVVVLVAPDAHLRQFLSRNRDTVAFLDAQVSRVPEAGRA